MAGQRFCMLTRASAFVLLVCGIAAAVISQTAGTRTYSIDQGRSRATIAVGKSGILSFAAGHGHEVIAPAIVGTMTVDPAEPLRSTVQVKIDASALKVTDKGEASNDVPKVQETMAGEQVLDVRRYPTIDFESTSVSVKAREGTKLDLMVAGRLTLHNMTRSIEVPVTARIEPNELTATGRFPLKQTDYGIKPVSVGGVVSVKDTVEISFTIVGR
jgi:polyisoprenoid-binding protein YceI